MKPLMKRELLIETTVGEVRIAILEDDQLMEVYYNDPDREDMVGNILYMRFDLIYHRLKLFQALSLRKTPNQRLKRKKRPLK